MRLKACLAAALAALLTLAPLPAVASDGPMADLAQAKADLKAAKAALDGYEGAGVLGFYRHEGSTDAVRILTDPDVTKYQDHIRLDDPDGPTALSKVRSALEFVEECNRLRAGEGLDALEVSDTAMAVAQAQDSYYMYDKDWNETATTHVLQFMSQAENLDLSGDDPFDAWYTEEKESYDDQKADGVAKPKGCGHYLNIIRSGYTATGFADGDANDTSYRNQVFIFDDTIYPIDGNVSEFPIGPTYTPAEYLKRLDDYQAWYDGLLADRKAASKAVDKAKAALRHVSGTVRSAAGGPIAGATATLSDGASTVAATSGADGSFDVKVPSDGTWTLTVSADGYVDATVGPIVIGDGQTRAWTGLDVRLRTPTAVVSGTVTDTDGTPMAGVEVSVTDADGSTTLTTGSDGAWSASVRAGSVSVSYTVPDGYGAVGDTSADLDLKAGSSAVFDLKLRRLSGTVRVVAIDPGGPVEGVSVTVGGAAGRTDADGTLTLRDVGAGTQKVRVTAPDGLVASAPATVDVPAGGTVRLEVHIKAEPLSVIPSTGRVPWILLTCLAALPLGLAAIRLRRHADLG